MSQIYDDAKIVCACGNVVTARATLKEIHIESCAACHPFYTGKQTPSGPKKSRPEAK